MYLRNKLLTVLKVKNILLMIAGVFFLFVGSYNILDLLIYYRNDIETALNAKSMPDSIDFVLMAIVFLFVVLLSRKLIGDARFYSSYFEGSLYQHIRVKDLAAASGKPAFIVAIELFFFRFLYMPRSLRLIRESGSKNLGLHTRM